MPQRSAHRLGLVVLALFFIGIYGRYLIGYAPSGGDIVNQYLPYQQLVRDSIRQGAAPLWNAMTFCGRPLMADIQIGVLYPPNWLHWFLPLPLSFALLLAAHAAWMLAGCWLLGRRWGLHPAAAALGAVLFAGSPFFTLKMSQGVVLFIYVGAWWPWLALATSRLVERPNFSRTIVLALALAMSLLAGSPQLTFYGWIATLALGLVLPGESGGVKPWIRRSALIAGAFVLAMALTAIQTFQTYYFVGNSFERASGAGWEYITNGSLAPRLLWLLLNPGYLGIGASEQAYYWPYPPTFGEVCFYLPLWSVLILAPLGVGVIFQRPSSPLHRRLALLSIVAMAMGLLLAPGKTSLIFEFFYNFVPGFNRFRVPARLMIFFDAGVAILASLAFNRLLAAPAEFRRIYRLTTGIGLLAILALLWLSYADRMPLWRAIGYQSSGGFASGPRIDRIISDHAFSMAARVSMFALIAACAMLYSLRRPSRAIAFIVPLAAAAELAWLAWPFQASGDPFNASKPIASHRESVYPQTALVKTLQAELQRGGRVLWLDDVNSWAFDQNQPEVYPNRMVMNGLADARGYDPVNAQWIGRWMNLLSGNDPNKNPGGFMFVTKIARPAWLTAMGVSTVISYLDLSHVPGLKPVAKFDFPIAPELTPEMARGLSGIHYDGSHRLVTTLTVWRNERFRGMAFAAPVDMKRVARNTDSALMLSAMLANDPNIAPENAIVPDLGFLLKDAGPDQKPNLTPAIDSRFTVRDLPAKPNTYQFETNFPAQALLCFAQSRYEGWSAAIGDQPSNIATVDGTFMGVVVPAGKQTVTFEFHPQGLVSGMWISVFALVFIVYVSARERIVNRKR